MKTILAAATALAAAGGLAVTVSGSAGAATSCHVVWGSGAKVVHNSRPGPLTTIRAGRHACFDRLVLDNATATDVRYVKAVRDQGRGEVVPLRGGAFLEIVEHSTVTRRIPLPNVRGYSTFRQVGWGGSFEGQTTVGLGVRARLPFRAFQDGSHVVIDVAHRW